MPGQVDPPQAWERVNAMARSQGLSLHRAVSEGTLTRSEVAGCVERCQSCSQNEACGHWLETHANGDPAPEYCLNRTDLVPPR